MNDKRPLKIKLSKNAQPPHREPEKWPRALKNVRGACPKQTLSDLPISKNVGSVPDATKAKKVGFVRTSEVSQKVHYCVYCDFPIAIYGRLIPCEHVFCLNCVRIGSTCHSCGVRIQNIQYVEYGKEVIYICERLRCGKAFIKKNEFESHIAEVHYKGGSSCQCCW